MSVSRDMNGVILFKSLILKLALQLDTECRIPSGLSVSLNTILPTIQTISLKLGHRERLPVGCNELQSHQANYLGFQMQFRD